MVVGGSQQETLDPGFVLLGGSDSSVNFTAGRHQFATTAAMEYYVENIIFIYKCRVEQKTDDNCYEKDFVDARAFEHKFYK
ncbi:unnamed protein product [Schistosoma mattheei]|uniref:Uncharacterized protein n=1 Tax=Schistosoma mattheei TaxID=31246 RepID=A0A183PVS4_9TREM|nr:unnamed protein product [Schistosoma mattheei]